MKYLQKFNESINKLLSKDDKEITSIIEIIEDTLIEFNIDIDVVLNTDGRIEDDIEFTTSVQINIKPEKSNTSISSWDGKVGFSIGNPYSIHDIYLDGKLDELILGVNRKVEFLNGIKSLHYRLQKNGYVINFFNYTQDKISFCFIVEDEKILKK